jgi:hypothetical protein
MMPCRRTQPSSTASGTTPAKSTPGEKLIETDADTNDDVEL